MKKIILFMAICLFPCISRADELPFTAAPACVRKILSKGSTVWVLVNREAIPDSILYKIDFDNSGKIYWGEEKDYTLFEIVNNENEKILKRTCSIIDSLNTANKTKGRKPDLLNDNWWSIETEWSTIERSMSSFLCYRQSDTWTQKRYQFPDNDLSVLHAERGGKRRVWVGGWDFVGYYDINNQTFTRLFFIDSYELRGIAVSVSTEEKDCAEEEAPQEEDYETWEEYNEAYTDYALDEDKHSQCFCDGRKIGYIQDSNGYVNFYEKSNICASVIGIILDKVRIFYRDDEDNSDWYHVEINDVMGYVQKSCITLFSNK